MNPRGGSFARFARDVSCQGRIVLSGLFNFSSARHVAKKNGGSCARVAILSLFFSHANSQAAILRTNFEIQTDGTLHRDGRLGRLMTAATRWNEGEAKGN